MSEPIQPALTPEEWADWLPGRERVMYDAIGEGMNGWEKGTPHALAALALHGQPFGFTWEHVDLLRCAAVESGQDWEGEEAGEIRGLADIIAALLPPREPSS